MLNLYIQNFIKTLLLIFGFSFVNIRAENKNDSVLNSMGDMYVDPAGLDPNCKMFIEDVIKELNMQDYDIEICKMNQLAINKIGYKNAFVLFNRLYVSEDFFKSLQYDVKKFLIAHELMHIKNNHSYKILAVNFISSIVPIAIMINYALNKIKNSSNKNQDLSKEQKIKDSVLNSFLTIPISFLSLRLLNRAFSRYCEKQADRDAVLNLKSIKGGLGLFEEFKVDQEMNKKPESFIKKYLLSWFLTHPSHDERIKFLKNLQIS